MTIFEAIVQHFDEVCDGDEGNCGLGYKAHWKGTLDPFGGVVHYAPRRFTRRALRNLLLLVAKARRLADPAYLNAPYLAYYHLYSDNVTASRLALTLGVRLPARLSRLDRLRCLQLARQQGVGLSKRSAIYGWAHATD